MTFVGRSGSGSMVAVSSGSQKLKGVAGFVVLHQQGGACFTIGQVELYQTRPTLLDLH